MGKRIGALAAADKNYKIVVALERPGCPNVGRDYGQVLGVGDLGVIVACDGAKVFGALDVLIDFSAPEGVANNIRLALGGKKALVIGTTAIPDATMKAVQKAAKSVACVLSPNMSPGVNTLLKIVGEVAKALGSAYDIEIVEMHHNKKKDAPSGTALKLAEVIAQATRREIARDGKARSGNEIVVHALRGGDVVGDHTVTYAADGEMVQISHRATSRDTFAAGALRAAQFVAKAKPGLYDMLDVMRG